LGNWFASFYTEQEKTIEKRIDGEIGIDLGVTNFGALAKGEIIKKPDESINNLLTIKKRLARAVSRKKKGGNNRKKAILVLKKIESKIANIRKDFLQKTSTTLSKNHELIVVENLKILNMSKSAKGTKENPGVNVKAKSGLNREILANGWGDFRNMLKYKQEYSGGVFLTVNPVNRSRKCSACGVIDKNSRVGQKYACTTCGYEIHADTNAAINILAAGRVALGDMDNISCLA
jgi:putative transposase